MKVLALVSLGLLSLNALALPTENLAALKNAHSQLKMNINKDYDFEGIVKLSNCSGSLIIFNGMPMTAKAVVMTNGHCIQKPGGYLNPGEAWVNRPIDREMKLYDANMKLFPIKAKKIIYATMTDTDVAYYELGQSYEEILKTTKVRPFTLDSIRPSLAQPIEIISGYWDRGYSCEIDNFVFKMKEGQWTWTDSIRYTEGCDTIGGTSGSPIIAKGEKRVIGINNTSNEKGERCTLNNPCEVSSNGDIFSQKGVRYGQQTYPIYNCLNPDFTINLKLTECDLPKGK